MGSIEEDYHNDSITTKKNRKQSGQPLKKITTMLALQQDNRKQSGQPLKKITTMLVSQQENRKQNG